MKNQTFTYRLLMAAGLLLLVLPFFLKTQFSLTDGQQGFIVGIGIGLEILAIFKMRKARA